MEEECPILQCKAHNPTNPKTKSRYPQSAELRFWKPHKDPLSSQRLQEKAGLSFYQWNPWLSVSTQYKFINLWAYPPTWLRRGHTAPQPIYISIPTIFICTCLYFLLSIMSFHTIDHMIFWEQTCSCYCFLPFYMPHWCHVYMGVQFLFLTFKSTNFCRSWTKSFWPWWEQSKLTACSELGGLARHFHILEHIFPKKYKVVSSYSRLLNPTEAGNEGWA